MREILLTSSVLILEVLLLRLAFRDGISRGCHPACGDS